MDNISAFMDGEAAPTEAQQTLNRLRQDAVSRETWDHFHLVGDVMRGDHPSLRDDFLTRLRQRLENEPTVLAPRWQWRQAVVDALPVAAALAFVSIATGVIMYQKNLSPDVAMAPKSAPQQLAQARPQPAASANAAQVNEYLMAHQEFSPRTALQGVVPYVRSVSATHDGNRR